MKKQYKILLILIAIIIFIIGYYLRAYLPLNTALPGSPYEVYTSENNYSLLNKDPLIKDFSDKATRYPLSHILKELLEPILGNLYIIYILGAIIVFFLGKELTDSDLGGVLAFSIYALSPENLLQYTRKIETSSTCYILTWAGLLFFVRYLKNQKNKNIFLFTLLSILALLSYHSGGTAIILLIIGISISLAYSNYEKKEKKNILIAFSIIAIFYIIWTKTFDRYQLEFMRNGLTAIFNFIIFSGFLKIFLVILALAMVVLILVYLRKASFLESEYIPLLALIPSTILIFSKYGFFNKLLFLGVKNYYSSAITLNNYLAQALLTHTYILILIPSILKKDLSKKAMFLRGWLFGLILVFLGLAIEKFHARIFDYSFPLMFVLFAVYWTKKTKFRKIVVPATIILLIISQLMIYNDPFTMRRYYNQEEIDSAQKIINLNLNGTVASDLRTSALFSYLGKTDVLFGLSQESIHSWIFYDYQNSSSLNINYVILSESMKEIVYDLNFETKPLPNKTFEYYEKNHEKLYDDGLMKVYKIKTNITQQLRLTINELFENIAEQEEELYCNQTLDSVPCDLLNLIKNNSLNYQDKVLEN